MSTTTIVLKPFTLGELLDQAIRLYRRNFVNFLGIMAITQIPISLLQLLVTLLTFGRLSAAYLEPTSNPQQVFSQLLGGSGVSFLISILAFILVQGVATAALTRAVADNYLGRPTGILGAYRRIGSSWLRLVGAILLLGLVSLALLVWTLVPCIGWVSGVGMLIFTGMVVLPLVAPIVVLENHSAGESIRRAWELARKRFWWILGFVFILYLFSQLLITGPTLLASSLLAGVAGAPSNPYSQPTFSTILQSGISLVMSLLYLPLQLTAITLLYFDLRIRQEGFDLTMLAREASGQAADIDALTTEAPAPTQTQLITWKEFGYFVAITFAGAVLYFLFVAILGGLMLLIYGLSGAPAP